MTASSGTFERDFQSLTGHSPMRWQRRLYDRLCGGALPVALDLPTGLGKTSVMALWYLAREAGAAVPRRLVYVVDRRVVVDQATAEAEKIRRNSGGALPISTLRGQLADNRDWLGDPTRPAIVVGTVDMVGSRLLFSGYGVSRKMRPYHAGLLGADVLLVLDESHLVPPFEALLETVESGAGLRPDGLVPPFRLLSLSATGRERAGSVFRLEEEDRGDPVVAQRLGARKDLVVVPQDGRKLEDALYQEAWGLAERGGRAVRCLIYCHSREVAEAVQKKFIDRKQAIVTELLVGARRGHERDLAAQWLAERGFLAGGTAPLDGPAFLIATAAGEVGIDLDADAMVCDTVAWERMVQRLGRVNRLGGGAARVVVVAPAQEHKTLAVLAALPAGQDGADASPGALLDLRRRAADDPALCATLAAATTPPPLRPELTPERLDDWAMTALPAHPGRPQVQPWLRGWIDPKDDPPQTSVVWRRHLPWRADGTREEAGDFFEAAPLHAEERLETETWRVVEWLAARAARRPVRAFILAPDGEVLRALGPDTLASPTRRDLDRLQRELAERTLVVESAVGGLKHGLLDGRADEPATTADAEAEWMERTGVRVRDLRTGEVDLAVDDEWREAFRFILERDGEDVARWLVVDRRRGDVGPGDNRSLARQAQPLEDHLAAAAAKALALTDALNLPAPYANALRLAARLHDAGKAAERWQQAFSAPRDGRTYAKTRGPFRRSRLDGYRHEVGSLLQAERDPEVTALGDEGLRDLVLHLISAHHGQARPLVATRSCDEAPPSALELRAAEASLRFLRLQRRWGPWGLAWWEALLRAADVQASVENDGRGG